MLAATLFGTTDGVGPVDVERGLVLWVYVNELTTDPIGQLAQGVGINSSLFFLVLGLIERKPADALQRLRVIDRHHLWLRAAQTDDDHFRVQGFHLFDGVLVFLAPLLLFLLRVEADA